MPPQQTLERQYSHGCSCFISRSLLTAWSIALHCSRGPNTHSSKAPELSSPAIFYSESTTGNSTSAVQQVTGDPEAV
jgi:hypothetical protein